MDPTQHATDTAPWTPTGLTPNVIPAPPNTWLRDTDRTLCRVVAFQRDPITTDWHPIIHTPGHPALIYVDDPTNCELFFKDTPNVIPAPPGTWLSDTDAKLLRVVAFQHHPDDDDWYPIVKTPGFISLLHIDDDDNSYQLLFDDNF